jgi:hypothetical protein
MQNATAPTDADVFQTEDDDGPYIAATPLETALIIGLPFGALVALCIAAWNGIEAVRAWLGA